MDLETQFKELTRGVEEILSSDELKKKLKKSQETGKPLRVKAGFDPTAPDLHLGHVVLLQKLRQFQEYGHTVYFLIGDYTARVGDPSGKSKTRPPLTEEEVKSNAQTYQEQVFKILLKERTEVVFNFDWLSKLNSLDMIRLAAQTSVARMLERDDFQKRYQAQKSISLHEFFYPLLQAHDSVHLKADIEFGGTDQKFNLLLGRELMKDAELAPQVCFMMPLLEGLDGVQKMSKSLGNAIGIDEPPHEIYGKLMSLPDTLMKRYYLLLSHLSLEEIEQKFECLEQNEIHPKDLKSDFAIEIVTCLYDQDQAQLAKDHFTKVVTQKGVPDDVPEFQVFETNEEIWLPKLLVESGLIKSTSEGKRLFKQGAVKIDGERLKSEKLSCVDLLNKTLQCGKRKFVKIVK